MTSKENEKIDPTKGREIEVEPPKPWVPVPIRRKAKEERNMKRSFRSQLKSQNLFDQRSPGELSIEELMDRVAYMEAQPEFDWVEPDEKHPEALVPDVEARNAILSAADVVVNASIGEDAPIKERQELKHRILSTVDRFVEEEL